MATLAEVERRVRDLEIRVRGTEQAQTENLALSQAILDISRANLARMDAGFTAVRAEMDSGFTAIRAEMDAGLSTVHAEIADIHSDIAGIRILQESQGKDVASMKDTQEAQGRDIYSMKDQLASVQRQHGDQGKDIAAIKDQLATIVDLLRNDHS